ncbi:MAG: MFS transporter [Pseudomonadota bacterium]
MSHLKFALVLGGCMGAASFGIDSLAPVLPLLAGEFGISAGQSQLALTLGMLGFSLGQIPAGMASDRYGRRLVLYSALSVFSLTSLAAMAFSDFSSLLALRAIQGLSLAGLAVSARAIVRDVASGVDAGALMSSVTTVMATATVAAPLVGGFFGAHYGWRSAFLVMAAYGIVCLLPVRSVVPAARRRPRQPSPWRQLGVSVRSFVSNRQSVRGVLVNAAAFSGLFGFMTAAAGVANDVYALPQWMLGPAIALIPLMLVAASQISRRIVRSLGLRRQERLAVGLLALASVGQLLGLSLGTPPLALVWGLAMFYALGFGLLMPVVTALVLDPQPRSAGFAAAILGTSQSAAGATASVLMAATYDQSVVPLCVLMGAAGLLAGGALLALGGRQSG